MLKIFKKFKKKTDHRTLYQILGEETGTYELVRSFYTHMENDPKAKECLYVHELTKDRKIPDEVKKKLFMFLCGWLGGPNLFIETYGPPKMRARHLGFKIGPKERNQWLYCMNLALKKHRPKLEKNHIKILQNNFLALATRIQNNPNI